MKNKQKKKGKALKHLFKKGCVNCFYRQFLKIETRAAYMSTQGNFVFYGKDYLIINGTSFLLLFLISFHIVTLCFFFARLI